MDLSKLSLKTLKVSRGYMYTYYTFPARGSKPTIMLFHGWPDTSKLWAGLINNYLLANGYGVLAFDNLGYGGTSKPTDANQYMWQDLAKDALDILDAEDVDKVVSFGHDWGSTMCQRFYNFYPERCSGLVMINLSYLPPSGSFDLDATNKLTRELFGAGIYQYWHFFCEESGIELMNKNLESVYTVTFGEPQTWLVNWTEPGAMRKYVIEGKTQPVQSYADTEHRADFMERLGKDGFNAPNCWYKAFAFKIQNEADKLVPEKNHVVNVPTLYWGGTEDAVCRPEVLQPSIDAGLLPQVESKTRPGGHWALLERPAEFGQDVLDWLEKTYK